MDEVLNTIQSKLETLQEELKQLQTTVVTTNKSEGDEPSEFEQTRERLMALMQDKLATEKIVSACMYTVSYHGTTSVSNVRITNTLDISEEDEEKMATVFEIFTNPRRSRIIKSLINSPLPANEISQKTGFVGGQLYHHLSILEDAGFIEKENDKYRTNAGTLGLLTALSSLISGVKIGKEEKEE